MKAPNGGEGDNGPNMIIKQLNIARLSLLEAYLFGCAKLLAFSETAQKHAVRHDPEGKHDVAGITSVGATTDGLIDDTEIYIPTRCEKCSDDLATFHKFDIDKSPIRSQTSNFTIRDQRP